MPAGAGAYLGLETFGAWLKARRVRAKAGRRYAVRVLALLVAVGIGLHNFGEGLAIGAAFALGEAALGTLLIIGFTLHNTTEGLAIVAPDRQVAVRRCARWRSSGLDRRRADDCRARGSAAWCTRQSSRSRVSGSVPAPSRR